MKTEEMKLYPVTDWRKAKDIRIVDQSGPQQARLEDCMNWDIEKRSERG